MQFPFRVPTADKRAERLDDVNAANYGCYSLVRLDGPVADSIQHEAVYLADLLAAQIADDPEVLGLSALLAFLHSHRRARLQEGVFVPLRTRRLCARDFTLAVKARSRFLGLGPGKSRTNPTRTTAKDRKNAKPYRTPKCHFICVWACVAFNIAFADIVGLYTPGMLPDLMEGVVEGVAFSENPLLVAAIFIQIPIAMIVAMQLSPPRAWRPVNTVAVVIAAIFVIGGGTLKPHYIFFASFQVFALLGITLLVWREISPGQTSAENS
jgi:hypothetical protein